MARPGRGRRADDLTWGVTKQVDGIGEDGDLRDATTREAKPHIAYVLLDEAQAMLVRYCAEAIKAGIAERRSAWPSSRARSCRHYSGQSAARMLDVVLAPLAERGVTERTCSRRCGSPGLPRPRSWSPMRSAG